MTVQLKRLAPSKLQKCLYDKSTSTPSSSCFLYLRTFLPVCTELTKALALFLVSSLSANFGQHDVGYADVATGRRGLSLPSLRLPTISQHRLSLLSSFRCQMLEVISQSSYVIQTITKLLRLMLVASGQAPSTFLCSSCFLYLRTFAPVPTPLGNHLSLFFVQLKHLASSKFRSSSYDKSTSAHPCPVLGTRCSSHKSKKLSDTNHH